MKQSIKLYGALSLALLVALGASPLQAGPCTPGIIQLTFDQYGDGTYQDTNATPCQNNPPYTTAPGTASSAFELDPTGQASGDVLVYELPELVLSGNVGVVGTAGDTVGTDVTDGVYGIAFTNSSGVLDGAQDANLMILYTDADLPAVDDDAKDFVNVNASGGFQWLPDGGNMYPNGNEYDLVTPEPATFVLIGSALILLAFGLRRKPIREA